LLLLFSPAGARRCCDVKTVKQRRSDVIRTSCAGWVASRCIHGYTLILKFREICCPLSRKEFFKNCYSRSLIPDSVSRSNLCFCRF